jgi:hypothetical protein
MAVSTERRRALEMLAGSPRGCTESIMMAHGCAIGVLRDLVRDGQATAASETMVAGVAGSRLPACGSPTPDGARSPTDSGQAHGGATLGLTGARICRRSEIQLMIPLVDPTGK